MNPEFQQRKPFDCSKKGILILSAMPSIDTDKAYVFPSKRLWKKSPAPRALDLERAGPGKEEMLRYYIAAAIEPSFIIVFAFSILLPVSMDAVDHRLCSPSSRVATKPSLLPAIPRRAGTKNHSTFLADKGTLRKDTVCSDFANWQSNCI